MALTSKQRAQLRGLAAAEDTIIQVGKGGINENLVASVSAALAARELVKGKVLENSMLTAREACDAHTSHIYRSSGNRAVYLYAAIRLCCIARR